MENIPALLDQKLTDEAGILELLVGALARGQGMAGRRLVPIVDRVRM